jgi:hypothetical protein
MIPPFRHTMVSNEMWKRGQKFKSTTLITTAKEQYCGEAGAVAKLYVRMKET